jgi:hypothetical protein
MPTIQARTIKPPTLASIIAADDTVAAALAATVSAGPI